MYSRKTIQHQWIANLSDEFIPFVSFPENYKGWSAFSWVHDNGRGGICFCSLPRPVIIVSDVCSNSIIGQVHGDRGHGYFVPAPESKSLAGRLDCEGLPVTCADPAACQVCHCFQRI